MQLNRLVSFYKTLGDPTRIRILSLLAKGPLHGQALAGKLGLTPPTITHHMNKLKDVSAIYQRREKNTIYFYINEDVIRRGSSALLSLIFEREDEKKMDSSHYEVVRNFLNQDGTIKQIPAQRKKKLMLLRHLIKGFERGIKYEEKEINEYIKKYHDDYATIRREFIMANMMYRDSNVYEVNPEELWAKIE
ncbi:metalloregulator ArsR/SmtB family transcription factor [Metabacillus iocasae]|uniref:HTH arsR-type domain-containing protein n=1 Tax=Priestia iocasae TaxID=2291674 RepID=A0ABS2QXF5_9BACI|nr:metalloregulator ArsR/SmtB family transcription factor [Metabacillus iocasae]MBM7703159.1 hypothetical protein [Metabacillus iocasae]